MNDVIGKIVKKYKQIVKERIRQDYYPTINYTNEQMYKEATRMYDTFINQFYSYPTTSYIRHGETKPGTGRGINLYRGQQIRKLGTSKNPMLEISFSGSDMEGGYEYASPTEVLEGVMNGLRFYSPNGLFGIEWSGSYDGKYFSYAGSMRDAFDQFGKDFKKISRNIFMEQWHKIGW